MINGAVLGAGNTSKVVMLDESRAAKIFHEHIHSDFIQQEFDKSKIIADAGLFVPKVYGVEFIEGKQAIIFEKVNGIPLAGLLGPSTLIQQFKLMAKLHTEIHQASGLSLPGQKQSLTSKIEKVNELNQAEKETIIEFLNQLPDGNFLCHGDYHPDNILLSDQGPIVIDWTDATTGNRLADVARTILILNYGGLPKNISPLMYKAHTVFRKLAAYLYSSYYRKLAPFKKIDLEKWVLPVAAARLLEDLPANEKRSLLSIVRNRLKKL